MKLIEHASITVRDLSMSRSFYMAVFKALGATVAYERDDAIGFGERNRPEEDSNTYISVFQSNEASPDRRRHWCFRAGSKEQVQAFHAEGLRAGGKDEGEPGIRAYHSGYYAAFLLDPEGNKIEAVYHHGER